MCPLHSVSMETWESIRTLCETLLAVHCIVQMTFLKANTHLSQSKFQWPGLHRETLSRKRKNIYILNRKPNKSIQESQNQGGPVRFPCLCFEECCLKRVGWKQKGYSGWGHYKVSTRLKAKSGASLTQVQAKGHIRLVFLCRLFTTWFSLLISNLYDWHQFDVVSVVITNH